MNQGPKQTCEQTTMRTLYMKIVKMNLGKYGM